MRVLGRPHQKKKRGAVTQIYGRCKLRVPFNIFPDQGAYSDASTESVRAVHRHKLAREDFDLPWDSGLACSRSRPVECKLGKTDASRKVVCLHDRRPREGKWLATNSDGLFDPNVSTIPHLPQIKRKKSTSWEKKLSDERRKKLVYEKSHNSLAEAACGLIACSEKTKRQPLSISAQQREILI